MIAEHVLLPFAGSIADADERLGSRAVAAVGEAVARVPPQWLGANPASRRASSRPSSRSVSRGRARF